MFRVRRVLGPTALNTMKKQIIANHTRHEIRIALLENGAVSEIFFERIKNKSAVGNIYKGRILKILPGMESAFVDIGLEKAGFLYVTDIRTETQQIDFENGKNENNEKSRRQEDKERERPNISSLIREGQDIMVQVSKGAIGTKGARISCNVAIPGRNLVFMPHANSVGISRQIRDEKERARLRRIVSHLKPEGTGFIVRTVASERYEDEFKHDIDYLTSSWAGVERRYKTYRAPAILYEDLNLTFRTIRDTLSHDVDALVIDDENEYEKVKKYLAAYLPRYSNKLKHFRYKSSIFDAYGVTKELDRALSRKVWLKSGGHLVFDHTEALTAVDVNTGRFTGSSSHEDTILTTNLEAAVQIAYQLKLRDIGGIIIIDFIDMESPENRQTVYNTLRNELKRDKARTKVLPISEIGLVEMTRKRNRENLGRYLKTTCPYCNGTARVRSPATTIYEIYQEVTRISKEGNAPQNLLVGMHPDVAEYFETDELDTFRMMERKIKGSISIQTSEKYHYGQYELLEL